MAGDIKTMTVRGMVFEHNPENPRNPRLRNVEQTAEFQVWFTCPLGTFETYSEAETACTRNDMLPELCIRPVPVLVGQDIYEILL